MPVESVQVTFLSKSRNCNFPKSKALRLSVEAIAVYSICCGLDASVGLHHARESLQYFDS